MLDKLNKGREGHGGPKGEANRKAVLSEDQVKEILRRYTPKCPVNGVAPLAREFGVLYQAVWRIIKGINWKHLKEPNTPAQIITVSQSTPRRVSGISL